MMAFRYYLRRLKDPPYPEEDVLVRFRRWKKPREGRIVWNRNAGYTFYDKNNYGYVCHYDSDPVEVTVISTNEKWKCYEWC